MVAHLDPEELTLLALFDGGPADGGPADGGPADGGPADGGLDGGLADGDANERHSDASTTAQHLDECLWCRREVAALRQVASIATDTRQVRELTPPPTAVWEAISAAVAESDPASARADSTVVRPLHRSPDRSARLRRSPGRRGGWLRPGALALAAALVGVVGTLGAVRVLDDSGSGAAPDRQLAQTVVSRTALASLPGAPAGAAGDARILRGADSERLHLHVTGLPRAPGYYEVWLIDPATMEMVSVGQLGDGDDVLLPVTSTTDIAKYRLVDVSAEDYDNNQRHSGRSLLRGELHG
jgi:hypothetical protein